MVSIIHMKKFELFFNLIAVPLDAAMLFLAGLVAFYSRPKLSEFVGPIIYHLTLKEFLFAAVPSVVALLLIFAVMGLYSLRGVRRLAKELPKIILGVSAGLFVVVVMFFFDPGLFPSRFIILASWLLAIVLVSFGRLLLKLFQRIAFARKIGLHRVVVVNGAGTDAHQLEKEYRKSLSGYEVISELHYGENIKQELEKFWSESKIDEVLQANPTLPDGANLEILEWCRSKGLSFSFVPNLFQVQQGTVEIEQVGGVPLISIKNTPLDGWGKVAKRIVDVVVSAAAMIVLSPVYLALYIAVKLNSPGPAIYAHVRGGQGKDFMFYKFRSMYTHLSDGLGGKEADDMRAQLWKKNDRGGADSPFLKIKHDPRVTPVGRFTRKTKLDEIPQFWNVLRGDMSLVGPRAHMLSEVNLYRDKYRRVFSIKPGIFGISQIEQMKWPDLPFEEEMRLCNYYIENWSLWMDVKILAKSVYMIFFGKKAKEDY